MRRIGFDLFHRFFNRFSDYPVPPHSGTFSLLDRFAYESLRTLPERHRFFPGLCAWIGYDQHVVTYHREERSAGQPKQTLSRLIRYSLDALFSFSYAPIRLMIYAGTLISLVGFSVGIYFIVKRLIGVETAFTGFTTLIVTILALGGLQLMALGVIGEYLARVYDETKGRPYYIVHPRQSVEKKSGSAPDA
jgi:dolichol-phosphate mannosyltransferase